MRWFRGGLGCSVVVWGVLEWFWIFQRTLLSVPVLNDGPVW